MTDKKFEKRGRVFLNRSGFHGSASVDWSVEVKDNYTEGSFNIRDCSNEVYLSLDYHEDRWYRNTVHKLQTLIRQAEDALDALDGARDFWVARQKEKAKEKKEKKK